MLPESPHVPSAFTGATPAFRRVGVTGGLGFVGRNLVRALHRQGASVTVFDLAAPDGADLPDGVRHVPVDLRDPATLTSALGDLDLLFHLGGNSSGTVAVTDPRLDFETNALGTFNVCEAARLTSLPRLVYLSSAMVYGTPQAVPQHEEHPTLPYYPYGASKLSGEHVVRAYARTYGLSAVMGRAFVIYGPGEDPRRAGAEVGQYLRWHLNGQPIRVTGDPDRKTRDFVHVHDIVTALLLLAARGDDGEVYNLGSGREVSLRQLVEHIHDVTGRRPRMLTDDTVTDDTYRLVADISRLRGLGYRPSVDLPAGLAGLVDALGPTPELPQLDTIFHPTSGAPA